jgi:hypothetical protein
MKMPNYIIQSLIGKNTTESISCQAPSIPNALKKRFSVETLKCKKNEIADADFMITSSSNSRAQFYKIYREKIK